MSYGYYLLSIKQRKDEKQRWKKKQRQPSIFSSHTLGNSQAVVTAARITQHAQPPQKSATGCVE